MIAKDQVFSGVRVQLDGSSFKSCRFENCVIVYSGVMAVELDSPEFVDCVWEMEGAARETVRFLTGLYQAGATDIVESAFERIRGNMPTGPTFN